MMENAKRKNMCGYCRHSVGIEGRNAMRGCNVDNKLHNEEDSCRCFEACYKFNLETGLPERCKPLN